MDQLKYPRYVLKKAKIPQICIEIKVKILCLEYLLRLSIFLFKLIDFFIFIFWISQQPVYLEELA